MTSKVGCGPNSIVTGEGDPFYDECAAHDEDYDLNLAEADADKAFIAGMSDRVVREPHWVRRNVLNARGTLYAGIVLSVGWVWYRYVGNTKGNTQ